MASTTRSTLTDGGRPRRFPPVSIGTRLFVALVIPISVLIVAFALFEDGANRARSRDEVAREGRSLARTVQLATRLAMREGRIADAVQLTETISNHENVLGVRLYDAQGRLLHAPASVAGMPALAPETVRRRLHEGTLVPERLRLGERPVLAWFAPLADASGTPIGASEVLQLESFVEEDAAASSRALAVFAAALVISIALTLLAGTRIHVTDPIDALVAGVRNVQLGAGSARLPIQRADELGRLAAEFNVMCDRLEGAQATLEQARAERQRIEERLREAERLAGIGRFAAGLAHEIGTPLNVIRGRAESLARRAGPDSPLAASLGVIVQQSDRVSRIVRNVLDFARAWDLRLAPVGLAELLRRTGELVRDRCEAQGIALEIAVAPDLPDVAADADRLQQVFLNLAVNAVDAMPRGGRLVLGAATREARPPEGAAGPVPCAEVVIADDGDGIAPEHLARVFDPFFTTKEVGRGTGLGLSIAYGIVREHGGWLELDSAPGHGTRARVLLPLAGDTHAPVEAAS